MWRTRLYTPVGINGSANPILDDPYNSYTWDGDVAHGPSRNAMRDWIESIGYLGNVVYVDDTYGNDYTAKKGNILYPYKTHQAAMSVMSSGVKGLCITFPGSYTITFSFGFPLKDQVDHLLLNATINITPGYFAYGSLLVYPSYVKCKIWGTGTFDNQSSNADWSQIVPYASCDLEIEGITFTGNKQVIGQAGSFIGQLKKVRFKNCRLISNDNPLSTATNAQNLNPWGDDYTVFENCYIKGTQFISTFNTLQTEKYIVKYINCVLEGNTSNTNGINAPIVLLDYGADSSIAGYYFEGCKFKSVSNALYVGAGFGGIGTNKQLTIYDCLFETGPEGWIQNESSTLAFKLSGNRSNYAETGTYPITNVMSGTGFSIDVNTEVVLH